jgi:hypothetical protein
VGQRFVVIPMLVQPVEQLLGRAAQTGAQARWSGGVRDASGQVVVSFALDGSR